MSLWLIVELLALGAVGGLLAGMLGVGGSAVMVPFLTIILSKRGVDADLSVKMAIATAMATVLFTSLSSMRAHHKRGNVRWDIVRRMAPGIAFGGLAAGAGVFAVVKGNALAIVFALFTGFSATQILRDRKPKASRQLPGAAGQMAAGGGIGFISGLVGVGGGFASVPYMSWCNVPMHNAVATSAALGFPIALANTAGYVISGWSQPSALPGSLGFVYLPALAVLASASVLCAPLGARAAHAMNVTQLKRVFACMLYALGGYMLWRALG